MIANRTAAFLTLLGAVMVCGLSGCLEFDGDALSIATSWTAPERAGFEAEVRRAMPDAGPIRWVVLTPGDDLGRVVRRRVPPDLILGGAASAYEAIAARGQFEPVGPGWWVVRRSPIGLALRDEDLETAGSGLSFDDPRRDSVTLAWAGFLSPSNGDSTTGVMLTMALSTLSKNWIDWAS